MRFWSLTKKTPAPVTTAETLQFEGFTVKVIRRSGLKNITLRASSAQEFRLSAPRRVSKHFILQFLESRKDWMEQQSRHYEELREWTDRRGEVGERYWYMGELLTLRDGMTFQSQPLIEIQGSTLWYHWPESKFPGRELERNKACRAIQRFWEARAREVLTERVRHYAAVMGVAPSRLGFRTQRARWGSCSSRGSLSLNLKLVGAPLEVIDAVVVHELSHLVHLNHSRAFWSLVEVHAPQHRKADQWLARHHQELLG